MHGNSPPDTYVYVTEEGVTRHYADGSVDALAWEDVVEVRVVGDSGEGVVGGKGTEILYVLLDRDGQGCVVPKSATDGAFLTRLRYLPDFDLDRLSAAVDAVRDSYVVVWRSPEPPSALPDLEYD
ncbi:hypothetical protein GCM10010156_46980 [Planobispora rosea]|uniref:Uncharacterized protein n=1 Tax=Planobispora rosea TaxID=35762 RepID=A0A8J3RYM1_PLARO|nr:hypothetical protein [Planobispora rosea]GGS82923.1 hypothetical protein GCM10010156_46980 [Planobispora rosea]GIH84187.1 hypothetical protein Pro02_25950 [Planobispora rosea]